jgi:hypothetical protein
MDLIFVVGLKEQKYLPENLAINPNVYHYQKNLLIHLLNKCIFKPNFNEEIKVK